MPIIEIIRENLPDCNCGCGLKARVSYKGVACCVPYFLLLEGIDNEFNDDYTPTDLSNHCVYRKYSLIRERLKTDSLCDLLSKATVNWVEAQLTEKISYLNDGAMPSKEDVIRYCRCMIFPDGSRQWTWKDSPIFSLPAPTAADLDVKKIDFSDLSPHK